MSQEQNTEDAINSLNDKLRLETLSLDSNEKVLYKSFQSTTDAQISELKVTQEKLKSTEAKNSDLRNQLQTLKQELRMCYKALEKEVGDGTTLQTVLNSDSGWTGRAEQISALQKKIAGLKRQSESTTNTDNKTDPIVKMYKDRQQDKEKIETELKELEESHSRLQQKLDASKTRHSVLINENKALKQQLQTLLDKGKHDDELITALFKQQSHVRQLLESEAKKPKEQNDVIDRMKHDIEEKEKLIISLETKLHEEQNKQLVSDTTLSERKVEQSPSNLRAENNCTPAAEHTTETTFEALHTERNKLMDFVTVLQKRNEEMFKQTASLQSELKAEQRRNSQLEKQLSKNDSSKITLGNKRKEASSEKSNSVEEIRRKYEIQQDENEALKAVLQRTLKAKEEDLQFYNDTVNETKRIYLQSIQQTLQKSS